MNEHQTLLNHKITLHGLTNWKWIQWFGSFCFLIFTTSIGIIIYAFIHEMLLNGAYGAWTTFDKITDQSNIILWIFMLFYLFFPQHSFMKGNKFIISAAVYIFFVFCGYNFILVPNGNSFIKPGDAYYNLQNMWLHVIAPIIFFLFTFAYMYYYKDAQPKSYLQTLLTGMIYPTIYCIYLISVPFVLKDQSGNAYSIYGSVTNTKEIPTSWAYICGMYFIFFPAVFAIFYYSWKGFNKIQLKLERVSIQ